MKLRELKITNTMNFHKEKFIPQKAGEVKFYSCGPTTYDFLHVGNARALVVGDLINRILRVLGYKVTFVRNYTDIDDKIIQRAQEVGRDAIEHAELFIRECEKDMQNLNMKRPDFTPKVSETIPEIIQLIEKLIQNGVAYEVHHDGGSEVLFHVPLFKDYGKLSKKNLESLQHGIRVQVDEHKKHPSDFVLWKPAKVGEPAWDSPWGPGRPGWHIECSAMAYKYLGETIDLHHGGIDLIFPHHENEIAQSEMSFADFNHDGTEGRKKEFCHYWCHNEFLNFGSEKMSKSLGNVVTIRKFIETYSGEVLRQILLSSHYRSRIEWNEEVIEKGIQDVEKIHQFMVEFFEWKEKIRIKTDDARIEEILKIKELILEELAQDFNAPGALGHFYNFMRLMRRDFFSEGDADIKAIQAAEEVLTLIQESLGCIRDNPQEVLQQINQLKMKMHSQQQVVELDESSIEKLIQERKLAKEQKNWQRADEIRLELKAKKIILLDRPDGSTQWKYE